MLDLEEETKRLWAVKLLQLFFRLTKREKANLELADLKKQVAAMHAQAAANVTANGHTNGAQANMFTTVTVAAVDQEHEARSPRGRFSPGRRAKSSD